MSNVATIKKLRSGHFESLATGAALVKAGVVSQAQLDICLRQQSMYQESGKTTFIEQILVMNRFCTMAQIEHTVDSGIRIGQSSLFQQILPVNICKTYLVYPLRVTNGVMELKSAVPLRAAQLETIRAASAVPTTAIRILAADLAEIHALHANIADSEFTFDAMLSRMNSTEINGAMLRQSIQAMLVGAIGLRASDIHIDKKPDPEAWISYRIDGDLDQAHLLHAKIMAALFTKMKTDSGMDASDDRRAQDGRMSIDHHGRTIDFRVATQPAVGGETMTLRVLDPESLLSLGQLFPNQPDMTELFTKIATPSSKRGGMVLFSGATGSGKTTSLYALVTRFARNAINILTVENPVEYVMPFTRQIQLNQLLNEQSVDVERSLLRQDPDVIVLGEIRDRDTMNAALQFAQSGHLVLASIHADNVPETFQRVMSFVEGADSSKALFMLANTLRVVVNQKLIPRLCSCAIVDSAPVAGVEAAFANGVRVASTSVLYRSVGCPRCKGRGYFGRVAAHETMVLPVDEQLRKGIAEQIAGSEGNFTNLQDMAGVTFKRRKDTLGRLLEAGIIDIASAVKLANQEFI